MKKDDYLQTIMLVPPKQHMQISKFDSRTQRDAFIVGLEGLKGVRTVVFLLDIVLTLHESGISMLSWNCPLKHAKTGRRGFVSPEPLYVPLVLTLSAEGT